MRPPSEPVDTAWVRKYLDDLLGVAERLPEGPMRDAVLHRAQSVLDMFEAWLASG